MNTIRSGWPLSVFLAVVVVWLSALEAAAFERSNLTVETSSGTHAFSIEIAQTSAEQAQGLMFRRTLADDHGMLFIYPDPRRVSFWMQNTFVSLDIIFIDSDGRVLRVEKATEPLSTRSIRSGGPVIGVLEVVAGTAERIGLEPGDRILHPLLEPR